MDNRYLTLRYNSKSRWLNYWYQIHEVVSRSPENLLVIGKGSGIVEHTIASLSPKLKIVTFDNDPHLLPDIVGDLRKLPFENSSFDCILCCQVLEHIPFEQIPYILNEFRRVVKDYVVISVPHKRKHIKLEIDVPILGNRKIILKYPFNKKTIISKKHHWEINRGVSYRGIKSILRNYFILEKTFLNEINCENRFFILKKHPGMR